MNTVAQKIKYSFTSSVIPNDATVIIIPLRNRSQYGVTIIESLVSMSIFLIVSVGIAGGAASFMKFNTTNEQKSTAIAATQQAFDELRVADPATLPTSGTVSTPITIGPRVFDVRISYCENSSYCLANSIRHITARTYFRNNKLYQVETVYAQLQ